MKLLNVPNGITCLNLLSGCAAIYCTFKAVLCGNPLLTTSLHAIDWACIFIICGAVFDFFDGMTARLLKVSSPIGKELDSLADVVTFGIAPSMLCYYLMKISGFSGVSEASGHWLCFTAFIMAAFSALRLAKFNVDERQTTSFIGLPTPANALFWIGMVYTGRVAFMQWAMNGWVMLALMAAASWILISEIPMFSLKIKFDHLGWRDNALRYSFVVACIVIFALFHLAGAAIAMLLYVLLSILSDARKTR
jgi:CDP-diacylglycerol--serine O-phosphatidyltransferase